MSTTPNTPNELLSLNNTTGPSLMENVESLLGELDYSQTLSVVKWLCKNMLSFHHDKVQELTKDGDTDPNFLTTWVIDSTHLWTVCQLLSKVD